MKIAIIEKGHFEVANTLISLFDNGDNEITLFIDGPAYEQLRYLVGPEGSRYKWVIQGKEPNREFIALIFDHIRSHPFDLIYFNTIADNFIHYAWHIRRLKLEKTIMTLHDINGFFQYAPSLNVRRLVRYLGKRQLIASLPVFNILSETLLPLLIKKLPAAKKVINIPGGYFNPGKFTRKNYSKQETLKITVPGSIDVRRRDYDLVFDLLDHAKKEGLRISVTLLGGFTKKWGLPVHTKSIAYLQTNKDLAVYETETVSQMEFDQVMADTHFIWLPLQPSTIIADGITEQYGTSISTGGTGDIIRYARPFFAPVHFNMDKALQKSGCRYVTVTEIADTIKNLSQTEYERLQDEALAGSQWYTREKIIERNASFFNNAGS